MDDKMFELMEKMYVEIQEMKSNMETKEDTTKIDQRLAVIENKMDKNHKALYDGYKLTYEKVVALEGKVDVIDKKVDKHDVEIRVIKGVQG